MIYGCLVRRVVEKWFVLQQNRTVLARREASFLGLLSNPRSVSVVMVPYATCCRARYTEPLVSWWLINQLCFQNGKQNRRIVAGNLKQIFFLNKLKPNTPVGCAGMHTLNISHIKFELYIQTQIYRLFSNIPFLCFYWDSTRNHFCFRQWIVVN